MRGSHDCAVCRDYIPPDAVESQGGTAHGFSEPRRCLMRMIRAMTEHTWWQKLNTQGAAILDELREIVREGNVRRVVVKQGTRTVAEFPLTAGVVGVVLAPIVAAIGALVALLNDCTIEVERTTPEP